MSVRRTVAGWIGGRGQTVVPTVDYDADMGAIRESLDTLLDRAKEDAGWELMDADQPFALPHPVESLRSQSRQAFFSDPYAKRATLLTTAFAFGRGIDGPTMPDGDPAEDVLTEFWRDPHNQATMFGTPKQYDRSNQLQVDGELCLLVYAGKSPVQVRRLSPDYVDEIITNPEDTGRVLYYRVEYPAKVWSEQEGGYRTANRTRRVYYADILNRDATGDEDPLADSLPADELAEDVYLLHVPLLTLADGQRGIPDSTAALRYLVRLKEITQDQATISRATAALMNRMSVSGDENAVEALASQFRPASADVGVEGTHTVPPLPGSMNVMNEQARLESFRASTNAGDARTNARLMKMGAAAGFGWALHYLADPENANLATATSMEGPQLKTMEAYQALWVYIYRTLCDFVLWEAKITDSRYDIPTPAIVQHPLAELAAAVLDADEADKITDRQASQLLMAAFGMDNLDLELEALADEEADDAGGGDDDQLAAVLAKLEAQEAAQPVAPVMAPVAVPSGEAEPE